jgi:hypothetical protein
LPYRNLSTHSKLYKNVLDGLKIKVITLILELGLLFACYTGLILELGLLFACYTGLIIVLQKQMLFSHVDMPVYKNTLETYTISYD